VDADDISASIEHAVARTVAGAFIAAFSGTVNGANYFTDAYEDTHCMANFVTVSFTAANDHACS
jgi:hypothetical protein